MRVALLSQCIWTRGVKHFKLNRPPLSLKLLNIIHCMWQDNRLHVSQLNLSPNEDTCWHHGWYALLNPQRCKFGGIHRFNHMHGMPGETSAPAESPNHCPSANNQPDTVGNWHTQVFSPTVFLQDLRFQILRNIIFLIGSNLLAEAD